MLGHRSFKKGQRYISISIVDTVDPAVPGAAAEKMVKPLYQGPRQQRLRTADQRFELSFETPKIGFLVKHGSTGLWIELTVKGPQDLARGIGPIGQIKEVAPDLATAAIERHCIAAHSTGALSTFGSIRKNPGPGISVGGEEVFVGDGAKLARGKGELLVLVDHLQSKAFSLGNGARQLDVLVARWAVDVHPGAHALTAKQRQDEARIVAAGQRTSYAPAEARGNRREIAVEEPHALLHHWLERLGGDCR